MLPQRVLQRLAPWRRVGGAHSLLMAQRWNATRSGASSQTSSFADFDDHSIISDAVKGSSENPEEQPPHPHLYSVPAMAARMISREAEVMQLWQNLLSGRRYQLLVGVDGVGKSAIAAEFCDRVRRSQRFTCIQWMSYRRCGFEQELGQFFRSMQGRREKDVLLVVDDVEDPTALVARLPKHDHFYVVLTSNNVETSAIGKLTVLPVAALPESCVEVFSSELGVPASSLQDTFALLGHVPLLLNLVHALLENGVMSVDELHRVLIEREVQKDQTLSVSAAVAVLLSLAEKHLEAEYPAARRYLEVLACFHVADLSDGVVNAVAGEAGGAFSVAASQLGLLTLKWEHQAFAMHPVIAQSLLQNAGAEVVVEAAAALQSLWPRRWRGANAQLLFNLVWHTSSVHQHFVRRGMTLTPDLISSMDKCATYLAHQEVRDLPIAAEMWCAIHDQLRQANAPPSGDGARVAHECGRLLHALKDPRAEAVLRSALEQSEAVYGPCSTEAALALGCLAPYLSSKDPSTLTKLKTALSAIDGVLASTDLVLGQAEARMLKETSFVLMMRQGQVLSEMQSEVPPTLWDRLTKLEAELRQD